MSRKIYLILVFIFSISMFYQQTGYAQERYTERKAFRNANAHWFIEDSVDVILDLRTSPPTRTLLPGFKISFNPFKIEPKVSVGEGGGGISDTATGDVLFYSGGVNVYNRFHKIMPNGAKIASKKINEYEGGSTMQQLSIVPFMDDPNRFHFFNLMSVEDTIGGLYYNVIDMRLDSGRGDVDTTIAKKYLYQGLLHEGMIAVPGNNCDVWVLVHPVRDSNFYAYHVTAEGLDTVPVISSPGTALYDPALSFIMGTMSVSPLRDKIAISNFQPYFPLYTGATKADGIMIATFDPETGKLSNGLKVDQYVVAPSHAFSSDGTKLYAAGWQVDSFFNLLGILPSLFQYDVSSMSETSFSNSKFKVTDFYYLWNGLRARGDTIVTSNMDFVSHSNGSGMLCGYNDTLRYADVQPGVRFTLGTDAAVYPLPPTYQSHVKNLKVCYYEAPVVLSVASGYHTYRWSHDAQINDSVVTITEPGTYWVEYTKFCHTGVDTFFVDWIDFPRPDISVNEQELSTVADYDSYQWMLDGIIIAGATSKTYTVTRNGDYQVIVTGGGCVDTSAPYKVSNAISVNNLVNQMPVRVYPNPASATLYVESAIPVEARIVGIEGKVFKKIAHAKAIDIRDLANGLYWMEIRNGDGVLLQVEKFLKSTDH